MEQQAENSTIGTDRGQRGRRAVSKSSGGVYAALLFDSDGQTAVVREPKFADEIDQLNRSSRTTLSHGGEDYLVEVILIGDQKDALKAEDEWEGSARARAVMRERKRRAEDKEPEEGGFLDIFPQETASNEESSSGAEDTTDGEGESSVEEVIPTKRRKTSEKQQKPVNIVMQGNFPAAPSTSTSNAGQLRDYLDFLPTASSTVKEKVGKFLTQGVVEVVTRREEQAPCCEHCFVTEDCNTRLTDQNVKLLDMAAMLKEIRDNGSKQNELIEEQNKTLGLLNENIEKLLKSNSVDLTFVDGIFDPQVPVSSIAPNPPLTSSPSNQHISYLSSSPCTSSQHTIANSVTPVATCSSSAVSVPISSESLVSSPQIIPPFTIGSPLTSGEIPTVSLAPVTPVNRLLPTQVRIGPHKYLFDIGADKHTFDEATGQIADSTIGKVLNMSDNVKTFCSTLAFAIYLPSELKGRCVDGSRDGKLPLSPRRKNAIRQSCMDNFNIPHAQRDALWRRECREAINKKLRAVFKVSPCHQIEQ